MMLQELFNDALPLITKFAPTIGATIGGPVGVAAGYIIPLLANSFGTHPSDMRGIAQKILTDSDAQSKLQALESEHGCWLSVLRGSVNNLSKAQINISLEWQPEQR